MVKKTINEWELEKGIEIKDTKGFCGKKNKRHNYKYSEKEFRKGARSGNITCKTEKGLEFLKNNKKEEKEIKIRVNWWD